MKLSIATFCLTVLIGSLPLSPNSASAQKAEGQGLAGTYLLNDPVAATNDIDRAIEATIKSMWFLPRRTARGKLKAKNLPPPKQLTISYTRTDVTIKTEAGTIQTPLDGTFVPRIIRGEQVQISTQWKREELERTFKGSEGQRVNTYSLSSDGNMLTMHVILTSPRLNGPCEYELVYTRKQ